MNAIDGTTYGATGIFVYRTFWPVNEVMVFIAYASNHFIHMQAGGVSIDLKYKLSHHLLLTYSACADPQ